MSPHRSTAARLLSSIVAVIGLIVGGVALAPMAGADRLPPPRPWPQYDIIRSPLSCSQWEDNELPPGSYIRVSDADSLVAAVEQPGIRTVLVTAGSDIDLGTRRDIKIASGLTLIGERGALCSRPIIRTTPKTLGYLFFIDSNHVTIRGIHFVGPLWQDDFVSYPDPKFAAFLVQWEAEPELITDARGGRSIGFYDNEMDHFSSGIIAGSPESKRTEGEYSSTAVKPTPAMAQHLRVERNYMHHMLTDGNGYGVCVCGSTYALILGNVFEMNRHDVASTGSAYSGYIAKYNYSLAATHKYRGYFNQDYDVHGIGSGGYGGSAGTYQEMAQNTVRGEQTYYVTQTRPVLLLRGKPRIGFDFHDNVVVHDNMDEAVDLKSRKSWPDDTGNAQDFNFFYWKNKVDTDTSRSIASGDFDGDGRSDVFLATGTAWFVSRGGKGPWEFLQASTARLDKLAFADMDGDGVTDVLFRAVDGNVSYSSGGWQKLTAPMLNLPVGMKDLRLGDFDADGRTDLFHTKNGKWWIWYAAASAWTMARTSGLSIDNLAVGDFDGVPGTDVIGSHTSAWWLSSGGVGGWQSWAPPYAGGFKGTVVADVNNDGIDDILFDGDNNLRVSTSGNQPMRDLMAWPKFGLVRIYPALKNLVVGDFSGPRRLMLAGLPKTGGVWFGGQQSSFPETIDTFDIWKGNMESSPQNMA